MRRIISEQQRSHKSTINIIIIIIRLQNYSITINKFFISGYLLAVKLLKDLILSSMYFRVIKKFFLFIYTHKDSLTLVCFSWCVFCSMDVDRRTSIRRDFRFSRSVRYYLRKVYLAISSTNYRHPVLFNISLLSLFQL